MSYEKVVVVNMDQEVTLTVRVLVGKRYSNEESLSLELTAPLFAIKDIQVKDIAEALRTRVLQMFMAKMREEREAYDQEQEMGEEITP